MRERGKHEQGLVVIVSQLHTAGVAQTLHVPADRSREGSGERESYMFALSSDNAGDHCFLADRGIEELGENGARADAVRCDKHLFRIIRHSQ